MILLRFAAAAFLACQVTSAAAQLSCTVPQTPMIEVELLFGRNIGGKLGVTDKLWAAFLAREVSPRFPDGLTVFDTRGQWRDDKTKALVREPGKIVRIILGADAGTMEKVDAVAAAYIKQFGQDSVGIVTRPACVVFRKP
jgi:hypothetical protein